MNGWVGLGGDFSFGKSPLFINGSRDRALSFENIFRRQLLGKAGLVVYQGLWRKVVSRALSCFPA